MTSDLDLHSPLLALPRELRDIIYALVLDRAETVVIAKPEQSSFRTVFPPLSNTCQQIRDETLEVLYSVSRWRIIISETSFMAPVLWLQQVPQKYRRRLRAVTVYFGISETLERRHEVLVQCASKNYPHGPYSELSRMLENKNERELGSLRVELEKMRHDVDPSIFTFEVEVEVYPDLFCRAWETAWLLVFSGGARNTKTYQRPTFRRRPEHGSGVNVDVTSVDYLYQAMWRAQLRRNKIKAKPNKRRKCVVL